MAKRGGIFLGAMDVVRLFTQWPNGVGSLSYNMDVTTLYALTRGRGIFKMSWMLYDFVRIDQRGRDL